MKNFFKSIRVKVYLMFLIFTAAVLLFLFASQVWFFPRLFRYMKSREVIRTVETVKNGWDDPDFVGVLENVALRQGTYIMVKRGNRAYFGFDPMLSYLQMVFPPALFTDELSREIEDEGMITEYLTDNDKRAMICMTYAGDPDDVKGYILIFSYIEPVGNTVSVARTQFFIIAALLIPLSGVLAAFVTARVSAPVVGISRSADKLAKGGFHAEINRFDSAEIRLLKENLNKASVEIAKTEALQKDLVANISHDLKTPLTMIKAYAEMIRDLSGDNPEKRNKHLDVIIGETDRLSALVVDILDLSRLQSGVDGLILEEFGFSERLREIIPRFAFAEYAVKSDIADNISITADKSKIERVVYNLITNAMNFTGADKTVTVRLFRTEAGKARFEVADSGKGIPEDQLPLIWDRYYKADNSVNHSRDVMGTGLGLSIVGNILKLHGFEYGVISELGAGSLFWFEG